MTERIGIIGVGAMGSALLKGLLGGVAGPEMLLIADANPPVLKEAAEEYGVEARDVKGVAQEADVVFIAVKPQDSKALLTDIAPFLRKDQVLVSLVAGLKIAAIEHSLASKTGVIRVMPNTPCLAGEGALAVSAGRYAGEKDIEKISGWLRQLGEVYHIPEKYMNAVTGLSGSGPAYVCLFIEALADGGVFAGLPRELAYRLAVQTVLGAAKMVRETGEHPAMLREKVTSPAGTTAAGLYELEKGAFRSLLQRAVLKAAEKSREMGI